MRLHKWLGWLAASLILAWAGLELSAPHEPALMAIVEDEYVTGAGYAAVGDQVASSSRTAMLPGRMTVRRPRVDVTTLPPKKPPNTLLQSHESRLLVTF
jgi:hypothetical protein